MVTIIKHELRAGVGTAGGYRPEGWSPRLTVVLSGPAPAGADVVWAMARPDGAAWFEERTQAPELTEGQTATVELRRQIDDDIDVAGTAPFTLRLVSELDGVGVLLHEGALAVTQLDGDHRFAVNEDWRLTRALISLDTIDEPDAPPLVITTYLKGDVDVHRLEAHCFHDGTRIARASLVESRQAFTANDGTVVGHVIVATFDVVRGWNNLAASGWGGDWYLLDAHDGPYEIKLVRDNVVTRTVPLTIHAGRIVAPEVVEADPWTGSAIPTEAIIDGDLDGPHGAVTAPVYGDPVSAANELTIDHVYALRTEPPEPDAAALDPEATAKLTAFLDRAERLIMTWEDDVVTAQAPFDQSQVMAAEALLREKGGYDDLHASVPETASGHVLILDGAPITVRDLGARMATLFAAASGMLTRASQQSADELAPYRAVLFGDKRRIFDDRPIDSFEYRTTDGLVISTPEELRDAVCWYFEGPVDLPSTGTVGDVTVTVSTRGWRIIGWQFDPDGTIVHAFEEQGLGLDAPRSAYRRR
ncbi:hypothetical protein [Herbiconiux liangxiaofengii]|uniref:hypothetical protein n=1 Tax=Herbiconiux liangxiaofengii TaxID=3342795 RepID=UPI0035BB13D6